MQKANGNELKLKIRNALLADAQLVGLLGGDYVFEYPSNEATVPHITISYSEMQDWECWDDPGGANTVTLQIWPLTGEHTRAQEFIDATQHALECAGFFDNNGELKLAPEYAGSRREPESREYRGILRYRAVRRKKAA